MLAQRGISLFLLISLPFSSLTDLDMYFWHIHVYILQLLWSHLSPLLYCSRTTPHILYSPILPQTSSPRRLLLLSFLPSSLPSSSPTSIHPSSHTSQISKSIILDQESENFFCKEPDSKHFKLQGLHIVSVTTTQLCHCITKAALDNT